MIKCGAFDSFGVHRSQMIAVVDRALSLGSKHQKEKAVGQFSFFDNELGGFNKDRTQLNNIVNKMDMDILLKTKDARKATIVQFNAPLKGVEDLVYDGKYLWTSDESIFKFYKCELSQLDA